MFDLQLFLLISVMAFSTYAAFRWLREEQLHRRRQKRRKQGRQDERRHSIK
jgi:uncharacterized membrane protein YidH (DUF202 family)